jgi:formylglycine-generating enzyme required for sulfatase activity
VLIRRDERVDVEVALPAETEVPAGFVYIPKGRFLFGTSTDDTLRQSFLNTVPIHPVATGAYLIARHETTYAEWIAYLKALRAAREAAKGPMITQASMVGGLSLTSSRRGVYSLTLQLANRVYRAREGETLIYEGRKAYAAQDWLRLPVSGVTRDEAIAYAAWLDESGRLPGARLCTEREWERAARGADEREFPSGDELQPTDANFDLTYGKELSLMGPDQVGLYPGSRSPFGVDDLAGNVFEWTLSTLDTKQAVARGGGYSYGSFTCRSTNRTILDPSFRDPGLGVRICASWPLHSR